MNLSLFKLFKSYDSDILFYLNILLNTCFLNNFVNTREYPWILMEYEKNRRITT